MRIFLPDDWNSEYNSGSDSSEVPSLLSSNQPMDCQFNPVNTQIEDMVPLIIFTGGDGLYQTLRTQTFACNL